MWRGASRQKKILFWRTNSSAEELILRPKNSSSLTATAKEKSTAKEKKAFFRRGAPRHKAPARSNQKQGVSVNVIHLRTYPKVQSRDMPDAADDSGLPGVDGVVDIDRIEPPLGCK